MKTHFIDIGLLLSFFGEKMLNGNLNRKVIMFLCFVLILCMIPSSFAADSDYSLSDSVDSVAASTYSIDSVAASDDSSRAIQEDNNQVSDLETAGTDSKVGTDLEDGKIKTNTSDAYYNDIKSAIDANSNTDVTIYIGAGIYNNTNSADYILQDGEANTKIIAEGVNISFVGDGADKTIIDGSHTDWLFNFKDSNINFINLSLVNAIGNHYSAIVTNQSNLLIENCIIANNVVTNVSWTHFSTVFFDNGYFKEYNISIKNSSFINNTGNHALSLKKANAVIVDSEFSYSSSGAIYIQINGRTLINNCTFNNNSAEKGASIHSYYGGNLTITNSHFTNSTASVNGGAIYDEDSTYVVLTLGNNTFTNCLLENGTVENIYTKNVQVENINDEVIITIPSHISITEGDDYNLSISAKYKNNESAADLRINVLIANSKASYSFNNLYTNESGMTSLSLSSIPRGNYNITVSLLHNDYDSSSKTCPLLIRGNFDYILELNPSNATIFEGDGLIIIGTVYDDYGDESDVLDGSRVYITYDTYYGSIIARSVLIDGSKMTCNLSTFDLPAKDVPYQLNFTVEEKTDVYGNAYDIGVATAYINVSFAIPENIADLDVIYVDFVNGDDINGNGSEENPVKTLRVGLDINHYLGGGKTIIIKEGNYSMGKYTIRDDVTVIGEDSSKVIISQNSGNRGLFELGEGITVNFTNLTFTNGFATPTGLGAVFSNPDSSILLLSDSIFHSNKAMIGGVINNKGEGQVFIDNCTFINNTATRSGCGGVIFMGNGYLFVNNSRFYNNTAPSGGAIELNGYLGVVRAIIDNSIFENNTSIDEYNELSGGGAIESVNSITIITDSSFINNHADCYGGALYVYGNLAASRCLFINNSANCGSALADYFGAIIDISYSVFLNNTGNGIIWTDTEDDTDSVTADNNWWGSNSYPSLIGVSLNSRVIMSLYNDGDGKIYATLDTLDTGAPLGGTLPIRDVIFTPSDNFDTPLTQTDENGICVVDYNGDIATDIITAMIDNQVLILEYDNFEGNRTNIIIEDVSGRINSEMTFVAYINATDEYENIFNFTEGSILFYINGNIFAGEADIVNGSASINYSPDCAGNFTIFAVFKGTTNYRSSRAEANLEVLDYIATQFVENSSSQDMNNNFTIDYDGSLVIKLIDNEGNPLSGKKVLLNITFIDEYNYSDMGDIFEDYNETEDLEWVEAITGADACINIDHFVSGNYTIYGYYEGDSDYAPVFFKAGIHVPKLDSFINVEATPNPAHLGNNIIISITLPEGASGGVSFLNNGTKIVLSKDGNGNYIFAPEETGVYNITALFYGDRYYNKVNESVLITVLEAIDECKLLQDLIDNTPVNGVLDLENYIFDDIADINISKNITITNGIIYAADGSDVIFNILDGENIVASDLIVYAKENNVLFEAIAEDNGHASLIAAISINNVTVRTMDDPNSIVILKVVTDSAVFNPSNPIVVTGNTFVSGVSPFLLENTYWENDSGIVIPVAEALKTTITLDEVSTGEGFITATLKDINGLALAGKTVKVYIGDIENNYTSAEEGKILIDGLRGDNIISFLFEGDGSYLPSSAIANFTSAIADKKATIIHCENMTTGCIISSRTGEYFIAKLTDSNGNALIGKKVQIGFNGKIYNRTTNETGEFKLQVNLVSLGGYTFAISFLGDEEYNASFAVAKITVTKNNGSITVSPTTIPKSLATYLRLALKTASGVSVSGQTVYLKVNGKTYSAKTDSEGIATVRISISSKGSFSYTAWYDGNAKINKVTKTGKITVV